MNSVNIDYAQVDFQYFFPLQSILESYMAKDKIELVKQAYAMAFIGHLSQTRSSGEPYITHPVAVATILANIFLDYQAIQAALLHDVVEDTEFTVNDLITLFGNEVAEIVDGVSKLDKLKFRNRQEAEVANFTKMIMAMTKNVKVVLIKLADRLHNLRTISSLRPDKQRRVARETLDIYSNIAGRLGIMSIKKELDDLCLKAIHPLRYQVIKNVVNKLVSHKASNLKKIIHEIKKSCKENGLTVNIEPQLRTLYRIYNGIQSKEFDIRSDMDIYNFIVIAPNRLSCYKALGILHSHFIPVHKQFSDFIAIPKLNGYQSLHTTLRTSFGPAFQVLIRTPEMDSISRNGILSKNSQDGENSDFPYISKWLNQITQLEQSSANINEFTNSVKTELFPNEVFVFTPHGKIIQMPEGSTILDFAFYIHTDLGRYAISGKVDGRESKLGKVLSSGQTVEIISDPDKAQINEASLRLVHSSLARNRIKTIIRNQHQDHGLIKGKQYLTVALNGKNPSDLPSEVINRALNYLGVANLDKLYLEIYLGHLISLVAADAIEYELERYYKNDNKKEITSNIYRSIDELVKRGFNIYPSQCCQPVPGDKIVVSSNHGKGLLIHHYRCNNLRNKKISNLEKISDVEWDNRQKIKYPATLRIIANKNRSLISKLIQVITNNDSDLLNFNLEIEGNNQLIVAIVEVINLSHLTQIIEEIKLLGIENIYRFINNN